MGPIWERSLRFFQINNFNSNFFAELLIKPAETRETSQQCQYSLKFQVYTSAIHLTSPQSECQNSLKSKNTSAVLRLSFLSYAIFLRFLNTPSSRETEEIIKANTHGPTDGICRSEERSPCLTHKTWPLNGRKFRQSYNKLHDKLFTMVSWRRFTQKRNIFCQCGHDVRAGKATKGQFLLHSNCNHSPTVSYH